VRERGKGGVGRGLRVHGKEGGRKGWRRSSVGAACRKLREYVREVRGLYGLDEGEGEGARDEG